MSKKLFIKKNLKYFAKIIIKFPLITAGIVCQEIYGFFIYLISNKPKILILNPIKRAKKIAIFAAYRKNLDMCLDLTLCELKKRGFNIVFVSNCKLNKKFIHQLKNKADIVIERGNYGRCLAAYKAGFLFIKSNNFYSAKDILFMNDTAIFPIYNSDKFWRDMDTCDAQIAGIYESNEISHHIQSFFIYCKNQVFLEPSFINFWIKYKFFNAKYLIIKFGEIQFSKMAKKNNFKLYAFINLKKLIISFNKNLKFIKREMYWLFRKRISVKRALQLRNNPSHYLALFSLVLMNLPLIKKNLLSTEAVVLHQVALALEKLKLKVNSDYILSELSIKDKKKFSFLFKLKCYMRMI